MVMGKTLKKCANKMSMVKRIGPNLLLNATRCAQVRRAVRVRLETEAQLGAMLHFRAAKPPLHACPMCFEAFPSEHQCNVHRRASCVSLTPPMPLLWRSVGKIVKHMLIRGGHEDLLVRGEAGGEKQELFLPSEAPLLSDLMGCGGAASNAFHALDVALAGKMQSDESTLQPRRRRGRHPGRDTVASELASESGADGGVETKGGGDDEWTVHVDEASGYEYRYNTRTGETIWCEGEGEGGAAGSKEDEGDAADGEEKEGDDVAEPRRRYAWMGDDEFGEGDANYDLQALFSSDEEPTFGDGDEDDEESASALARGKRKTEEAAAVTAAAAVVAAAEVVGVTEAVEVVEADVATAAAEEEVAPKEEEVAKDVVEDVVEDVGVKPAEVAVEAAAEAAVEAAAGVAEAVATEAVAVGESPEPNDAPAETAMMPPPAIVTDGLAKDAKDVKGHPWSLDTGSSSTSIGTGVSEENPTTGGNVGVHSSGRSNGPEEGEGAWNDRPVVEAEPDLLVEEERRAEGVIESVAEDECWREVRRTTEMFGTEAVDDLRRPGQLGAALQQKKQDMLRHLDRHAGSPPATTTTTTSTDKSGESALGGDRRASALSSSSASSYTSSEDPPSTATTVGSLPSGEGGGDGGGGGNGGGNSGGGGDAGGSGGAHGGSVERRSTEEEVMEELRMAEEESAAAQRRVERRSTEDTEEEVMRELVEEAEEERDGDDDDDDDENDEKVDIGAVIERRSTTEDAMRELAEEEEEDEEENAEEDAAAAAGRGIERYSTIDDAIRELVEEEVGAQKVTIGRRTTFEEAREEHKEEEAFVVDIMEMGVEEAVAREALRQTESIDAAIMWALDRLESGAATAGDGDNGGDGNSDSDGKTPTSHPTTTMPSPVAAAPKSLIPNIRGRCTMGDLKEDFKYNESMKEKIEEMSVEYDGYRPIRGDGNCYYRAVSFSFLERAMHAGAGAEGDGLLRTFIESVTQRDFQGHAEAEASRDYVVGRLREWMADRRWSWETTVKGGGLVASEEEAEKGAERGAEKGAEKELETELEKGAEKRANDESMDLGDKGREDISAALQRSFVEDEGMDKGMVRVLRHATSSYIREHRDDPMPSGMTYDMTVTLGMDFPSLDKYFDDMLEKMGEDAATVVHVALPLATGITVRMEYLDRRAGVEQKAYDFPEDDQPRHAFILIKPGHFDMLYAKADDALPAAAPMAGAGGLEEYISPRCARGLLPDAILEDYELWQRDASTVMGYPRSKKGKAGSQVGGSGESLHIKLHRQAKGGDADGGQAGITEHTATVVRTTENGDEELLLNVLGAAPGSALHRLGLLFSRLDNLSHILVWSSSKPRSFAEAGLESKGGESNESKDATPAAAAGVKEDVVISRVELPRLRLSFGVKAGPGGVPKLFSMDHDGLFVSMGGDKKQEMYAAHTRGLPHALIMENSNEQLYLLVPNYVPRRVKVGECPFSTDVVFDRSEEWRSSVKSRCYVYVRLIDTLLNDCLEPCRRSARMMVLTT